MSSKDKKISELQKVTPTKTDIIPIVRDNSNLSTTVSDIYANIPLANGTTAGVIKSLYKSAVAEAAVHGANGIGVFSSTSSITNGILKPVIPVFGYSVSLQSSSYYAGVPVAPKSRIEENDSSKKLLNISLSPIKTRLLNGADVNMAGISIPYVKAESDSVGLMLGDDKTKLDNISLGNIVYHKRLLNTKTAEWNIQNPGWYNILDYDSEGFYTEYPNGLVIIQLSTTGRPQTHESLAIMYSNGMAMQVYHNGETSYLTKVFSDSFGLGLYIDSNENQSFKLSVTVYGTGFPYIYDSPDITPWEGGAEPDGYESVRFGMDLGLRVTNTEDDISDLYDKITILQNSVANPTLPIATTTTIGGLKSGDETFEADLAKGFYSHVQVDAKTGIGKTSLPVIGKNAPMLEMGAVTMVCGCAGAICVDYIPSEEYYYPLKLWTDSSLPVTGVVIPLATTEERGLLSEKDKAKLDKITIDKNNNVSNVATPTIPVATDSQNGLMSKEDKNTVSRLRFKSLGGIGSGIIKIANLDYGCLGMIWIKVSNSNGTNDFVFCVNDILKLDLISRPSSAFDEKFYISRDSDGWGFFMETSSNSTIMCATIGDITIKDYSNSLMPGGLIPPVPASQVSNDKVSADDYWEQIRSLSSTVNALTKKIDDLEGRIPTSVGSDSN